MNIPFGAKHSNCIAIGNLSGSSFIDHLNPRLLKIFANLHSSLYALNILGPESPQVKPVLLLANARRRVEECFHERIPVFARLRVDLSI
jgi:hypothetical protein